MNWFLMLLLLPHLKPPSFEYMWPMLDTLFDLGRVASALLILYIPLLKKIPSK